MKTFVTTNIHHRIQFTLNLRITARTGTRLRSKDWRGATTRLQDAHNGPQRWQRLVAQARQLVTDRGCPGQKIARTRTATAHQAIANIENRPAHFARPAVWTALWRTRAISQPVGSLFLITVLPFVKPFPAVFRSNLHIDSPVSNGSPFVANSVRETSQHLPKDQFDLSEDTVSNLVAFSKYCLDVLQIK